MFPLISLSYPVFACKSVPEPFTSRIINKGLSVYDDNAGTKELAASEKNQAINDHYRLSSAIQCESYNLDNKA